MNEMIETINIRNSLELPVGKRFRVGTSSNIFKVVEISDRYAQCWKCCFDSADMRLECGVFNCGLEDPRSDGKKVVIQLDRSHKQ